MAAGSTPNSRLENFESAITAGHILMTVDVPPGRVSEIRRGIVSHHLEATNYGPTTVQAFP